MAGQDGLAGALPGQRGPPRRAGAPDVVRQGKGPALALGALAGVVIGAPLTAFVLLV